MKRALTAVIIFAGALCAQNRSVDLSWTASVTPGVTYNVYRAPAACSPLPTNFVKQNAAPIATTSFSNTGVPTGTYCYYVTAAAAGLESGPSNNAGAAVGPIAPTGLTVTVQVAVNVTVNGVQVASQSTETGPTQVPLKPANMAPTGMTSCLVWNPDHTINVLATRACAENGYEAKQNTTTGPTQVPLASAGQGTTLFLGGDGSFVSAAPSH